MKDLPLMGKFLARSSLGDLRNKLKDLKVLIWDIECAGVMGLRADLGYMTCFGYKWFGQKKTHVLNIHDYKVPGRWQEVCQQDHRLLQAAHEVMAKADLMVAHYGDKFDRPYYETRLLINKLPPLPMVRQVDTCWVAQKRLKFSSNRLANLAEKLGVNTLKMEKRGGWPKWWMGALRGDVKSIMDMAHYCGIDVECLEQVFDRMLPIIPRSLLIDMNMLEPTERTVCPSCGGDVHYWGYYFSERRRYRRYYCTVCFKPGRELKPEKV